MTDDLRQVVITGMGLVSPIGNTPKTLWQSLCERRSGVGPFTFAPPGTFPMSFAAEAGEFSGRIDDFGRLDKEQTKAIRKGLKVMCRECQMGVAVAQKALSHAGLAPGDFEPERTGVAFGSDYMLTLAEEFTEGVLHCLSEDGEFDFRRWPVDGMPKMSPLWLLKYLPNMPASHVAIYNDLRGPNNSLTLREAVPNVALGEAYQAIARDRADVMIAGATGTRLHPMKMIHAVQNEELADGDCPPEKASRPFDLHRTGMVLGEGAGAVILEERGRAERRGAEIFGEVLGTASSASVGPKLVARRADALATALSSALRVTGLAPESLGHVQAHGLGTRSCDSDEAQAINAVLGVRADPIPVTAAKSYFGNLGAGSGMVELIAGILAIKYRLLFPVLNYETPDPDCPISVVREEGVDAGNSFVNLSVTPQGQASAAILRAV
ncbi:MAG: beta-ketoacyl-[acyl-carrier-protein] synthase family protein [Planctomycetaceae bacterium]|nr:beta-ketoacyl-[acyl-carrier-protein] synthase family protein [Planctomycetaceae bacterium]